MITGYTSVSGNAYAREELTSSASVQGCSVTVYRTAAGFKPRYAVVQTETAAIRYTLGSGVPNDGTKVGQVLAIGASLVLVGEGQIDNFAFVWSPGAATVHIEYFS